MEPKEIELIRLAQNGDANAFEKLIVLHDRSVWQVAFHMLGNQQDTQDIYQDTFMRAFEKIHTFQFKSSFKSWLIRITINLCINYRKRKRVISWVSLFESYDSSRELPLQWVDNNMMNPEEKLKQKEIQSHILSAMERLSGRERAVFTLKQFQGLKISEIAGILHCAEGSVKNYLFRATQKMRNELTPFIKA